MQSVAKSILLLHNIGDLHRHVGDHLCLFEGAVFLKVALVDVERVLKVQQGLVPLILSGRLTLTKVELTEVHVKLRGLDMAWSYAFNTDHHA